MATEGALSRSIAGTEIAFRRVLGIDIALLDYEATIALMDAIIERGERGYLCAVSVHGLMEARRDPVLAAAYAESTLSLPDGMPVVWACNRLGANLADRVYGPTLMERYCERLAAAGRSVWLYGGHDEAALEELRSVLAARFHGLRVAGAFSPPHRALRPEEEAELAERIDADRPDVVWVGVGVPKQEHWMLAMRERLAAPLLVGVGAAFDFLAGRVSQAPAWMQRRGLEWAYRLAREPRRLGPRYLRNNPAFLAAFARQLARERRGA